MKKINWGTVGKIAKEACEIAIYGLVAVATIKICEPATEKCDDTAATYGDAVRAIMDSDMFSHYKKDAVKLLKRDGTASYYKAIIHVVENDSMFSHDKLNMIEFLAKD